MVLNGGGGGERPTWALWPTKHPSPCYLRTTSASVIGSSPAQVLNGSEWIGFCLKKHICIIYDIIIYIYIYMYTMIGRSCGALSGISGCRAVCDSRSLSKLRPGR